MKFVMMVPEEEQDDEEWIITENKKGHLPM